MCHGQPSWQWPSCGLKPASPVLSHDDAGLEAKALRSLTDKNWNGISPTVSDGHPTHNTQSHQRQREIRPPAICARFMHSAQNFQMHFQQTQLPFHTLATTSAFKRLAGGENRGQAQLLQSVYSRCTSLGAHYATHCVVAERHGEWKREEIPAPSLPDRCSYSAAPKSCDILGGSRCLATGKVIHLTLFGHSQTGAFLLPGRPFKE